MDSPEPRTDDLTAGMSALRAALPLLVAGVVLVVAELLMLVVLTSAARDEAGLIPDQVPLIVVAIVWGLLTLGVGVLAIVGARNLLRRGALPWLPLVVGAVLWIVLSALAFGLLRLIS